jgi:hypothetical protein
MGSKIKLNQAILKHFYVMKIKGGTGDPPVLAGLWPGGATWVRFLGAASTNGTARLRHSQCRRHPVGCPPQQPGRPVPPTNGKEISALFSLFQAFSGVLRSRRMRQVASFGQFRRRQAGRPTRQAGGLFHPIANQALTEESKAVQRSPTQPQSKWVRPVRCDSPFLTGRVLVG